MDTTTLALFKKLEQKIRDVDLRQGGPRGPKGRKGDSGNTGPAGPSGKHGVDGRNGKDGQQGPKGAKGTDGARGPAGVAGAVGPAGSSGADGHHGLVGADGRDGVSVLDAQIDIDGSLTIYLSDGSEIDAGRILSDELSQQITYVSNSGAGGRNWAPYIEDLQEQIDQIVQDLAAHIGDFNNPHQTSLANLTDTDLISNPLLEGQGLWYDEDTGLWKNRGVLAEAFPTGLIDGGELNIGPGANDIEVIAGFGVLTDSYTDPLAPPTVTGLGWPQINTAITAAPPVAGSIVWFSLTPTTTPSVPPEVGGISVFVATLKQYSQPPSPPLARAELFLGVAVHNGVSWQEVSNPKVVNQVAETLREFVTTVSGLSRIISGGNVSEQNNFTLNQEEGVIWEQNRNWHNDKSDPNREVLPAAAPVNFRYVTRDFGDVETITDTFDPDRYDAGSGAPINVPGNSNRTTIQRLYLDPANNYWVLWGQEVYRNFFEAEANLLSYTPEVPFLLQSSIFLGSAVIEKGKNDWDVNEAIFIPNGASGAGQGGGGTAISEYINLTDTPATYALDKRKVATVNELELGLEHDYRSKYVDNYAEGSPYYPQEWVSNSTWIAIANTETTEPAFPQEVGELQALYPDSPPFSETSQVAQVRSGYGATFTQNGEVRSLKVWVPEISVDITYALVFINDPNGTTPSLTRIPLRNDQLSVGAWSTVSIGKQLYTVGSEVLVYLESLNRGTSNTVTGGWTYNGQDNVSPPATSGWNHNNAKTIVRIDKTDLDTTDRSSELLGIVSGSTLLFAETANPQNAQTYITLSPPTDQGTYFEYAVTLTNETGSLGTGVTTTFTGTVPVAQATKFVFEADKFLNYPAWADITSFLQYDDVDQPVDQNIGYGINFDFQQLSASADWDLIPIGGGGGGGGGDFTPETFAGAGTTGYVPDPVTEDGKYLLDDGTWSNTIDGGTF